MRSRSRSSLVSFALSSCFLLSALPAMAGEVAMSMAGPRNVVQGHPIYLVVSGKVTSGSDEGVDLTVEGLPPGADWELPDMKVSCCGTKASGYFAYKTPFDTGLVVTTGADTPPGSYTVKVTGKGKESGVVSVASYDITVNPVPTAPSPGPLDLPAIPSLATWESQMVTYGQKHCDQNAITACGVQDACVQYYDGTRVYFQIADYTGDSKWNQCAQWVKAVYRDTYVIPNKGGVPGYRVFPHGLAMDFARNGDDTSKQAELMLAEGSAGAKSPLAWIIDAGSSREVAYGINAKRIAEQLGTSQDGRLEIWADIALGHLDEWFVSGTYTDRIAPFMVGLTAEALIDWQAQTGDVRVLPALKTAADWMWQNAWIAGSKAFWYEQKKGMPASEAAPDLNLLIAPMYAWIYRQTGDAKYRDEADQIFVGGVEGAYLDGGKQYSQNYRWSFQYVKWRTEGGGTGGEGGAGGTAGSSGQQGGSAGSAGATGQQGGSAGSTGQQGGSGGSSGQQGGAGQGGSTSQQGGSGGAAGQGGSSGQQGGSGGQTSGGSGKGGSSGQQSGAGGSSSSGKGGSSGQAGGQPGASGSPGAAAAGDESSASDDSGCGCRLPSGGSGGGAGALALGAAAVLAGARRRRRAG